jgi:hypothetical protein
MLKSLLTLSDVMCTGHHAAKSAGVTKGDVVAVVGDGAVGLSAILASHRLGADRIIGLSRNPARQDLARAFGATDIVAQRGAAAEEAVLELTNGIGVDAALECVGTGQSMATAFAIARPGSTVGIVGVPHDVEVPFNDTFFRNVGWRGGPAPARIYSPRSSTTSSTGPSTQDASSTTRPTSTMSPTPTRRWSNGVPSSRSCEWGRCDDGVDQRRAHSHRRRRGTAARFEAQRRRPPPERDDVGRPRRR